MNNDIDKLAEELGKAMGLAMADLLDREAIEADEHKRADDAERHRDMAEQFREIYSDFD